MEIHEAKKLARLTRWKAIIEEQQKSGLSIRRWCEQHDLTVQQFYYRLRNVRNAVLQEVDPSNEIRIVRLAGLEASTFTHNEPAPSLIIVRHQKSSIEFPADTDIHCIARLLKELNS